MLLRLFCLICVEGPRELYLQTSLYSSDIEGLAHGHANSELLRLHCGAPDIAEETSWYKTVNLALQCGLKYINMSIPTKLLLDIKGHPSTCAGHEWIIERCDVWWCWIKLIICLALFASWAGMFQIQSIFLQDSRFTARWCTLSAPSEALPSLEKLVSKENKSHKVCFWRVSSSTSSWYSLWSCNSFCTCLHLTNKTTSVFARLSDPKIHPSWISFYPFPYIYNIHHITYMM